MPKNIVICCDGAGNEFGDHNSSVVKLYSFLIIDGRTQMGCYHPGVGTRGRAHCHESNQQDLVGFGATGIRRGPALECGRCLPDEYL